jgi:hypothetical protein
MPTVADTLAEYALPLRIRQALLVTALRRLGGPVNVSARDAFDAAAFDVAVERTESGFVAMLKPASAAAKG